MDSRPKHYKYWEQLVEHLNGDTSILFNEKFIYPRQFEIHLPSNHKVSCNLNCPHCAGRYFIKDLGNWELTLLELISNLKGEIPYHIYGGAYTEPLLNPYLLTFLAYTKKYDNHFGIHTNGTLLNWLEKEQGWLTELNRLATDEEDYLSISIDAGLPWSWAKTKGTQNNSLFFEIIEGLKKACSMKRTHAIRLCYLISPASGNYENFASIVSIAKDLKVDSLRFSIPFASYNQNFNAIREYKKEVEIPGNIEYGEMLKDFISTSKRDKPYIFWNEPYFTDIDRYTFDKCFYHLYQVTLGADGYFYRCSTTATPTAKHCRLGKATSDIKEFKKIMFKNYDKNWNCKDMCFSRGLRCNRMGLEINRRCHDLVGSV
jgi:MoaA/NifB/PqqE/SkfB family radical SAM enzyme